ncbi:uncharacterized protein ACRADG_000034 isoform 1-T2 [Cochliomyia hominivorax]
MIYFICIVTLTIPVLAVPQGYIYNKPTSVTENYFLSAALPCTHPTPNIDDASLALINSQSEGRIVNHKTNFVTDHNLLDAASGYIPQTQTKGLNTIHPKNSSPPLRLNVLNKQQATSIHNQEYFYAGNQYTVSGGTQNLNYKAPQFLSTSQIFIKPNLVNHHKVNTDGPSTSGLVEQQNGSGYASSFGHINNIATPVLSYHNMQEIPSESNSENSLLSTGAIGSYPDSSVNNAHFSNIKYDANNLDFNIGELNGQLGHVIRETFANAPLDPTIEKHIYVHVPPEDLEEDYTQKNINQQQISIPPKKHYKIIFIKAPSYPIPNYQQLIASTVPQTEEKTLVYVLVKKPEVPPLEQIQQIQQSSYKSSKPEVYFIKYKTRKENDSNQHSMQITDKVQSETIPIENGSNLIDIRSGNGSTSSYRSTAQTVITNEPKHELYGVPLQ